jgi:hypothetical protein
LPEKTKDRRFYTAVHQEVQPKSGFTCGGPG